MQTFVKVKNCNEHILALVKELVLPKSGDVDVTTIDIINRLYDTDYEWDYELREGTWPSKEFMDEFIGSKWISIQDDVHDEDSCNFIIETAWSVPIPFLQNLANKLGSFKEDCYLVGTYEDESYSPIGAFVFGKDYDDIEDFDEEVDTDRMWDDDDYRESIFDELNYHKESLESGFIEYLVDRKNNPQDYE